MVRVCINILLLIFAFGFVDSIDSYAQGSTPRSDSKNINVCGISFLAPANLKDNRVKPIDSCVGSFSNDEFDLFVIVGWYGGPVRKDSGDAGFKQEAIEIDGKKGQFAAYRTYKDRQLSADQNLIASIYVPVSVTPIDSSRWGGTTTSLTMTITMKGENDIETARRIFQSIRFDK